MEMDRPDSVKRRQTRHFRTSTALAAGRSRRRLKVPFNEAVTTCRHAADGV
jgi:hypothetical protein